MLMEIRQTILNKLYLPVSIIIKIMLPVLFRLKKIYYLSTLKAHIRDIDSSVQCDGPILITGTSNITIGKRCRLGREVELNACDKGAINMGNDVRVNRGCTISSYSVVTIGDYSIIGEFTSIRDGNHGMDTHSPMRYQPHTSSPVQIGKDVWIGRGCCILPGVSLGDGSVIGSNSVVTRDIPPFSIAAGVPAKVIKTRGINL
jgi:acetyltransferase-like isoleucine patch superfamily enzyme